MLLRTPTKLKEQFAHISVFHTALNSRSLVLFTLGTVDSVVMETETYMLCINIAGKLVRTNNALCSVHNSRCY
jgi:hypothetical protein